jgi:hypothetical protein
MGCVGECPLWHRFSVLLLRGAIQGIREGDGGVNLCALRAH